MNTTFNPIALVTGGSRGLGKNTALHLAKQGSDVILTYRGNQPEAEAVVAQIKKLARRAVAMQLAVGNSSSFTAFVARVRSALTQHWQRERINYLINNASIATYATLSETSEAQFVELR